MRKQSVSVLFFLVYVADLIIKEGFCVAMVHSIFTGDFTVLIAGIIAH